MKRRSEENDFWEKGVNKIVGLGSKSIHKSYFPELKEKIASLDRQNVFYQSVLNSIPDCVVITDPSSIIIQVNPAMVERFGYAATDLTGQHISILYGDQSHDLSENTTWSDMAQYFRCKDGSLLIGETHKNKIYDGLGALIGHVEVIRDITKRVENLNQQKRLEEQLLKSQKMEAIGSLAGGIAHDFNNILSGIIGYAELIEIFKITDPDDIQTNIKEILQASYRARDLVKQILTFSRQDGQEFSSIALKKIAHEALQLIRASIPHNIVIKEQFEASSDTVLVDSTQIHQVLTNLCTNAIHAMIESGGTLTLRISQVESKKLRLSTGNGALPETMLSLEVFDTGSGISPEIIDHIFEPYFTTKRAGEGTGFGLSLVHGIVKSHDGYIEVDSQLGQGTCFRILLPQRMEQVEEKDKNIQTSFLERHGHILLVDDEPQQLGCGREFLEKLGFTVTALQSGLEAIRILKTSPTAYDILITDQTMPSMTGLELATQVREIRTDIPIILCTGYSHTLTSEKIRAAGITKMMNKPYSFTELIETLQQVQS